MVVNSAWSVARRAGTVNVTRLLRSAPPSFVDCCDAATGRSLMYTSVARLGIDSAARARRELLASVFRRSHCGSARGTSG